MRAVTGLKQIAQVAGCWRRGGIGGATFAALYFLSWQIARHGSAFAARKRKSDPPPVLAAWLEALEGADARALPERLRGYPEGYQFRGVSARAPAALGQWLRGNWPLELHEEIPSPRAVLRAQARGTRGVTAITAYPRMLEPVRGKADGFAFFLHDLEHAFKFFQVPALHAGQRAFFAALEVALERGVFGRYCEDPVFARKLDHLISDMNTHPQHGRQYLRATLIEACLRRDGKPPVAALAPAALRAIDRVMRAVDPPTLLAANV